MLAWARGTLLAVDTSGDPEWWRRKRKRWARSFVLSERTLAGPPEQTRARLAAFDSVSLLVCDELGPHPEEPLGHQR